MIEIARCELPVRQAAELPQPVHATAVARQRARKMASRQVAAAGVVRLRMLERISRLAPLLTAFLVLLPAEAEAGHCVTVTINGRSLSGELLARQDDIFWLGCDDGEYLPLRASSVDAFQPLRRPIRPVSIMQFRSTLRAEFGREYDVQTSGRHVVVGSRTTAAHASRRCEEIARSFKTYFARRSIPLQAADYPMAVVIARDRASFETMSAQIGVVTDPTLQGFYSPRSNRVLLYDPGRRTATRADSTIVRRPADRSAQAIQPRLANGDLDATLVHELIHQLAFNTGLHSRTGANPQWVVEGLATMLEPDATRRNAAANDPIARVNRERMYAFATRVRPSWTSGRLAEIVASDDRFTTATLDAYAEAWALTFFLSETRSGRYATLLRNLADRKTLHDLPPAERTAMFQTAFGRDIARLEIAWLRYMDAMAERMELR